MSKAKQKIEINGIPFGTGSIGMSDSTYKQLPANIKQGDKLKTLTHFRNSIQNGEWLGEFTIGNHTGYLFKYQDNNILVDKDVRMVLAAYKDKVESSVHICKPKINKSSIKPLPLDNKPDVKIEPKPSVVINENIVTIGDLTVNLSTIELSSHFLKRCKERFYITEREYAYKFVTDIVLNGEYLGIAKDDINEINNEAHLFVKKAIGIFISLDGRKVKTTYEKESITHHKPKELVKSILQKRINKLKREESKIFKRNQLSFREINKQIAEYDLLEYRAKSQSKKLAYRSYINGLVELKHQYETEHLEKAKELNDYTKSMIAFT